MRKYAGQTRIIYLTGHPLTGRFWYWVGGFLLLLISTISAPAQTSKSENPRKWYHEALKLYNLDQPTEASDNRALTLFLAVADAAEFSDNHLKSQSLINAGNIHQGYGRFAESNKLYHRALYENKQLNPKQEQTYEAYLYLGSSMYFNGILDSAKFYFELASAISVSYRDKLTLPEQGRLYNSLGAIYYEAANYRQAINYFKTAEDLATLQDGALQDFYITINSNIASCLIKLHLFDSSLHILRNLKPSQNQKKIILQNTARAYFEKGVYDSALAIYSNIDIPQNLYRVAALNDIGRIYVKQGKWELAKRSFDSAISINKRITGNIKNKDKALSYLYKADLSLSLGQTEEAIAWSDKALQEIHLTFTGKPPFGLPDNVTETVSPITFFQILLFRGNLLYKKYHQDKKPLLLTAALKNYLKAVETANFISKNIDNDDAKIFFIENAKNFYNDAIKVAYESAEKNPLYIREMLFILEGYKGNILRQNLEYSNLKKNAAIPDSLIKGELEIKKLYAAYLSELNLETNENEAARIQKKLSSLQVELSRLQKSYEKYDVSYWSRNNHSDQMISISEIQQSLGKETAMVNYFVTDNEIYTLAISHNKVAVQKVVTGKTYHDALKKYLFESFHIAGGTRYNGYHSSEVLFQTLLQPVYNLVGDCKKLIIIPDKYLFYLPFDALVKPGKEKDYLIYSHAISYHYSFSLLLQKSAMPDGKNFKSEILAFAPFSAEIKDIRSATNMTLPFSGEEIDLPAAHRYYNIEATKQHFLEEYNKFKTIHMATHASLGSDSSSNWIQFYPVHNNFESGRMYIHEIYNLQMAKNSLVVLSACESGTGISLGGEGLLSLSRAFMYAGADGIVSTLYKTDDRVTAFLMKQFYIHLEKGLSPAEALRQSKIDLLETDQLNSRLKSPNYWSNFVYIGKTPLAEDTGFFMLLIYILSCLVAVLLIKWWVQKWIKKQQVKTTSS